MLDSKGVAPRRGKALWSLGSINALLKNTHYIGHYHFQDKKIDTRIEVKCPAIVDTIIWSAVQQARKTSRTQQKNRTKNFYLLRDLMFCEHCDRPISGRIKPVKNEYLYYCPNKERAWVTDGGSKNPWKRGIGCGMARSLNIPETDKLIWNTVVDLHKKSSILKEEVKRRILYQHGISHVKSEDEIKVLNGRVKKLLKERLQAQEAQGSLEVNFLLGELDKKVYEFGVKRVKEKIAEVDVSIANTEIELKGSSESKKWIDWVKMFGDEIIAKKNLTDEEKKDYLSGLIRKIKVLYLAETNEHQLTIQFQLPIVKDGIKWKNPKEKSLGYKLINGREELSVILKKKDLRRTKDTP
jgi:hypothetical protein